MAANEVIKLSGFREQDDSNLVEPMEFSDELPAGTLLLNKQYTITGYLNSGGFGITYVAKDSLNRSVVIKECFPGFMCKRVGKDVHVRSLEHRGELASIVDAFINEAHALAALDHKGIVKVHQVFEENKTAYMAMDYVKGLDLAEIIDRHPGALSPTRVVRLTRRILNVVAYVHHRGILHRDISPDNILIAKNGEPMLIDFGSAYEHIKKAGTETAQMKFVKDGYSPQEFYLPDGDQGPWSDIYSLAATLYDLIRGAAPAPAQARLAALAKGNPDPYVPLLNAAQGYPPKFLKALDRALALMPEDRFQSAEDWLVRITKNNAAKPAKNPDHAPEVIATPRDEITTYVAPNPDAPKTDDEEGLMAAVNTAAELRDANIRTILNEPEETPAASAVPRRLFAGLTLAIGIGAIGYYQFYAPGQNNAPPAPAPQNTTAPSQAAPDRPNLVAPVAETNLQLATPPRLPAAELVAPQAMTVGELAQIAPNPAAPRAALVPQDLSVQEMGVSSTDNAAQFPSQPLVLQPSLQISAVDAPLMAIDLRRLAELAAEAKLPKLSDISPVALALSPLPMPALSAAAELPATKPLGLAAYAPSETAPVLRALDPARDAALVADLIPPAPLPEPVIPGPVLAQQIAFSHWDVDMPFVAEMQKLRNAATAVVTELSATADFDIAGGWISQGTRIFTYNGQTLDVNTALSGQVLNAMTIDPDGYTRGTVRYRDPNTGQIDRGLLAVPVVREIGLADGTAVEGRIVEQLWQFTVLAAATDAAPGDGLQPGDRILQETITGIEIATHEDFTRIYERLASRGATEARFRIQRGAQGLTLAQPLARAQEARP